MEALLRRTSTSCLLQEHGDLGTGQQGGCPLCGGALKAHDRVKRHTRTETSEKVWHRIWRLKCRGCGKLHRELLEFMLPYKHNCADRIESVLDDKLQERGAENSTLNCWKYCSLASSISSPRIIFADSALLVQALKVTEFSDTA